jgi:N-acetylglucosaminyl-diphospho-decaprenol L-rhamnosyltransferase
MNRVKLPVIAAIPNYNMANSLQSLLPSLIKQGYDHIYVLDDASTDNSREIVSQFASTVTFVAGDTNMGAGAARNLILEAIADPVIIHFLDADIRLETQHSPEIVRRLFDTDEPIGFIGGLVKTPNSKQSYWNFGERQTFTAMIGSWGQAFLESFGHKHPKLEIAFRRYHLWPGLTSRPNPTRPPIRRTTFWVSEANFMIRSDTFRRLGGFDEAIREHDIQTLAIHAQEAGLINYFDPSVAVTHLAVNVRKYFRPGAIIKAETYLAKKYGFATWLFSNSKHNQP